MKGAMVELMKDQKKFDLQESLELREEGLKKAEHLDAGWVREMRHQALEIARFPYTGNAHTVSSDDLREMIRLNPATFRNPTSPKAWGAIFNSKLFVRVGDKVSTYPPNHGRRIGVYKPREKA